MVSVSYEQVRGLRSKHESGGEFKIGVSKTVPIPLRTLYAWWTTKRTSWLKKRGLKVTSATTNKYLHWAWPDGTKVDIFFTPKGTQKSNVVVQHAKLKSASAGTRQKKYWSAQLDVFARAVSRQSGR